MKIIVCFKTVADSPAQIAGMLSERYGTASGCTLIDDSFIRKIFNCFDESALEMALRLAEQTESFGEPSQLTALTIDTHRADIFLKHLYAVQYDHAVRIDCGNHTDLRFNPLSVSLTITSYMKQIGQQRLVFLGAQGGEGDNRQTGLLVAERLGWPCIRDVIDVTADSSDILTVTSQTDDGILMQTVALPLVLVAGNAPDVPYLRAPTLKQKLKAMKKQVPALSFADLGLDRDAIMRNDKTLTGLQPRQSSRRCVFIEGDHAREKARHLYERYLKKKLAP